jgi:hypothetical protein
MASKLFPIKSPVLQKRDNEISSDIPLIFPGTATSARNESRSALRLQISPPSQILSSTHLKRAVAKTSVRVRFGTALRVVSLQPIKTANKGQGRYEKAINRTISTLCCLLSGARSGFIWFIQLIGQFVGQQWRIKWQ